MSDLDDTVMAQIVARVRELEADLAMLRDADQDATGRFAASDHLTAKWHPHLRRLMRERDKALAERDQTRATLYITRRDVNRLQRQADDARKIIGPRDELIPDQGGCEGWADETLTRILDALGEDT